MTVFDRRIGGSGRISAFAMVTNSTDAQGALERMLARAVAAEGVRNGIDVLESDVWVTGHWDTVDDTWVVHAFWAPNPEEGVVLVGGPLDGQLIRSPRADTSGRPVEQIETHGLPQPAVFDSGDLAEGLVFPVYRYRRAGIDPDQRRWVYRFVGEH